MPNSTLVQPFSARSPYRPAALALLLAALPAPGSATILQFDQIRVGGVVVPTIGGNDVEPDYGDRVTGSPMAVSGGQFTYGEGGEGFTPNVVVDYPTAGSSLWETSYGDLVNNLFGGQNSGMLEIVLTADAGFDVELHHFELGGWPNADYLIRAVRVLAGGASLFEQADVLVQGNATGPRHTAFDFATPLAGSQLRIQIDYGNLPGGQHDNIGIDNVRFGQNPPPDPVVVPGLPEPATALLLGAGLVVLARRRAARANERRQARAGAGRSSV